ncbi:hypothetical protein H4Q26_004380 [Puccinia striiformis f. sp. tritici PST-130]|nr:hypothetical protein H4Q26_004380 [Puccinia striiformis f. sp. tritici PST-130]
MADPAPPPHQTPSRAPSRQSTRVITPVRTDPNFIRPSQDSRKSLSQRPATTDRGSEDESGDEPQSPENDDSPEISKSQQTNPKRPRNSDEGETSDSHVIDITQDSDVENEKVKKKERAKNFDNIKKYFEAPFHEDPEYSGDAEKMMYKCRWCHNPYKKSKGTFSNLTKHRDGTADCLPSLSLATDGYLPSRETLGFVPNLSPITEESSEIEPTDHFVVEDVVLDDPLSFDENNHPEQISSGAPCSKTHHILQKVDFIIQRITSSAAKRAEYEHWCKILEPTGRGLIAGYGIRWNIKFESRDWALHSRKWDVVKTLNETLSEFYFLTKKTEGDISSGCTMISDYQCLMSFINEKLESCTEPEFKNMFNKMLSKTKTYLDEALDCDAIVIATALNPCFRLSIFQAWFPSHYSRAHKLLQDLYNEKKKNLRHLPNRRDQCHPRKKTS